MKAPDIQGYRGIYTGARNGFLVAYRGIAVQGDRATEGKAEGSEGPGIGL